ncbi:hypothetical protein E2562_008658 [Oryza meyeriana var. granulata]|uniref:Uncharacterized protein n=1 Tax=Oryza meyeriana var. granulata TaxID=110450 RepID=A0A6G1F5H9_9ORYZ|nr:hypothetical protein E2562_008658 [Oryza meyeriana var. granulata]
MPLLAAAVAPLSYLHSLSSRSLRIPFPCEARPLAPLRRGDLAIRMGGGPRTYPGGVSKWQWKRMQARKAKQLLKARLARERQLYEMRKRAELRDAVAHLERPWDPDASASTAAAAAPNLLSVAADDQLKALADRFHRPGGVDLWNDRDGPQVFASPDTGRASARFFPKNAVHSVQPYAVLGGDAESTLATRGNADDAMDQSDRVQGVRENAAKNATGGDHDEPAVEYIERGGVWEPVNNLDDHDDNRSSDRRWNHDNVTSDLEDMGDVDFQPKQNRMVGRDRRKGGVSTREATNSEAVGDDDARDQDGSCFSLDPEGTSGYHLGQSWQERNSGSRGKRPAGRRKALNTDGSSATGRDRMVGGNSFSDSEVTRDGFEPKWRARTREGTMNGVGRWKPLNEGGGNVPRKGWMDDEFGSKSDSEKDGKLEPKWRTQNRFNRSENDSSKPELKYSSNTSNRKRPERSIRGNNDDVRRDRFVNHFASDLEEPKWKPRRKNRARANNGYREYVDNTNGGFRRSSNGAARLLDVHPLDNNRVSSQDGSSHRMSRNGGRRLRGDGYSLRPTSELRTAESSCEGKRIR